MGTTEAQCYDTTQDIVTNALYNFFTYCTYNMMKQNMEYIMKNSSAHRFKNDVSMSINLSSNLEWSLFYVGMQLIS